MRWPFILLLASTPLHAESLVATRTLLAKTIIGPLDTAVIADTTVGALTAKNDATGMEARITLYAGRAIRAEDLARPAVIERNQIVPLIFAVNNLAITVEARALARGAPGDEIKVMNLSSRITLNGHIAEDGSVQIFTDQ